MDEKLEITLYMCRMKKREKAFAYIAHKLHAEDAMITNLDSLYDYLTEPRGKVFITIRGALKIKDEESFAGKLIATFTDADENSRGLTVSLT